MTPIIQLKPEGRFQEQDLERLVIELEQIIRQKEVMHAKEVAAFLGVSERTVYRSGLPVHRVHGLGRLYLRSELIEFVKKH